HDTGTSSVTAIVDQHPGLTIGKVESVTHVDHALQEIDYTVTVSNTGNMDLTGVTVTDVFVTLTSQSASLAVGHSEVLTDSHTVTQAEIDAATTLVYTYTTLFRSHDTGTSSVTAIVDQHPGLTIGKVESVTHVDHALQEIDYTVTVS